MKHAVSVFATKIADYGLRFVTSVLIARFLGPADKGMLTFVILVTTWAVMFGNFSLTEASVYLVGKGVFAPDLRPCMAMPMGTFFRLTACCATDISGPI